MVATVLVGLWLALAGLCLLLLEQRKDTRAALRLMAAHEKERRASAEETAAQMGALSVRQTETIALLKGAAEKPRAGEKPEPKPKPGRTWTETRNRLERDGALEAK